MAKKGKKNSESKQKKLEFSYDICVGRLLWLVLGAASTSAGGERKWGAVSQVKLHLERFLIS